MVGSVRLVWVLSQWANLKCSAGSHGWEDGKQIMERKRGWTDFLGNPPSQDQRLGGFVVVSFTHMMMTYQQAKVRINTLIQNNGAHVSPTTSISTLCSGGGTSLPGAASLIIARSAQDTPVEIGRTLHLLLRRSGGGGRRSRQIRVRDEAGGVQVCAGSASIAPTDVA